jgi:hypothetical protein
MVRLRSVGVMSCAKIYGLLNVALGILFAIFFVLIALVGLAAAPAQRKFGMVAFFVFAVLCPFIYGAIGFVTGAIGALLYNWIASSIGGIEMELEAIQIMPAAPPVPNPGILS